MQHVRGLFPSKIRLAGVVFALAAAAACLFSGPVSAQTIYKWVDERGVVNYGNADVPKKGNVSVVDTTPAVIGQPAAKPHENTNRPGKAAEAAPERDAAPRMHDEGARMRPVSAPAASAATPAQIPSSSSAPAAQTAAFKIAEVPKNSQQSTPVKPITTMQ
jgi:uncharacterized protein DUF4124